MKKIIITAMLLSISTMIFAGDLNPYAICYLSTSVMAENQPDVTKKKALKDMSEKFFNFFITQGNTREDFNNELIKLKPEMSKLKWDELVDVTKKCFDAYDLYSNNQQKQNNYNSEDSVTNPNQQNSKRLPETVELYGAKLFGTTESGIRLFTEDMVEKIKRAVELDDLDTVCATLHKSGDWVNSSSRDDTYGFGIGKKMREAFARDDEYFCTKYNQKKKDEAYRTMAQIKKGCRLFLSSRNTCATAFNYQSCMQIKMGAQLYPLESFEMLCH